MTQPFYVSPEQLMKDRADFARKGIARGRSVVVLGYDGGIAFATENPSRALHKISEIYDRIAFAAVGKYNEFENLRVAGVRYADLRGYSYDRIDVTARGLANAYAQTLGAVFTTESKPLEVELAVTEVGVSQADDQIYRLAYDGSVTDEPGHVVMGGDSERLARLAEEGWRPGMTLEAVIGLAVTVLGTAEDGTVRDLPPETLEAAVLDRTRTRRAFRRLGSAELAELLADAADTDSDGIDGDGGDDDGESRVIRRIFGLETEFGVTCAAPEGRGLSAEEVARYLFRKVVAWGRSSNVFLANGSRLYLDVGSHPEYATAECDDLRQLVAHDKAGELILHNLAEDAQERLEADGVVGRIHLFKNNLDSAGNSYGCHENYLIRRRADFARTAEVLVPFLITRQILTGSGHVLVTSRGPIYTFSQRADHLWEATSSATTRSRPIINTRDEPHADAEEYRRLHVISGDSSMSQTTTMLKVGMTDLMLRMLEAGVTFRDFTLENPVRAIREISHDLTAATPVPLARGLRMSALEMQTAYLERATAFVDSAAEHGPHDRWLLDLWGRGLAALAAGDLTAVETELDWVIKKRLIDGYRAGHDVSLSDPRVRRLDLAYHDISPTDGLFARLVERGLAATVVDEDTIATAADQPPQTTRAKLRGDFVRAATSRRRDYTVDWVHLKINDQAGRTVLCKDPFRSEDPRVERLIAGLDRADGGGVLGPAPASL